MLKTKVKKTQKEHSVIGGRIMERIRVENIQITKPYIYLSKNLLLATTISFFGLFGIFFSSIMFYKINIIHFLGNRFLFEHFPWFTGGLAICCILVAFALLEYHKVFYRFSNFSIFTTVLITILGIGFLSSKTGIHSKLEVSSLAGLYNVEEDSTKVYAGKVLEVHTKTGFILETLRGEKINVYIPTKTRLPEKGIVEGESLFIAGSFKGKMFFLKGLLTISGKRLSFSEN